jgi:hypothetical protein
MKPFKCSVCGQVVVGFQEDIDNKLFDCLGILIPSPKACNVCTYIGVKSHRISTIHGESGFMTEGTIFDSIDSIHDHEKDNIEKAAEERELIQFSKAVTSM